MSRDDKARSLGPDLLFSCTLASFASKVVGRPWIQVSTTCGSGWVDVEHAIFLLILNADG